MTLAWTRYLAAKDHAVIRQRGSAWLKRRRQLLTVEDVKLFQGLRDLRVQPLRKTGMR